MKIIQNDDNKRAWFPERRIDIEKLKSEEEEIKEIKETMRDKAKNYKELINVSLLVACVSAITMLIFMLISVSTHKQLDFPEIITISGIVMMTGCVISIVTYIAKNLWKRKLRQKGIFLPFEYD